MTRLYLKLSTTFLCVFLVLAIVARALGSTQPPNPALRGFVEGCEDKPQPCWYGIVPGVTTVDDAQKLFTQFRLEKHIDDFTFLDLTAGCTVRLLDSGAGWNIDNFVVQGIQIYDCPALKLGNLLSSFGRVLNVNYANPFYVEGAYKRGGYLTLENGLVATSLYENSLDNWFSLHSQILSVIWRNVEIPIGYPWYGFTTHAYYCQREPNSDLCV